jgi:acyl carrier protein
MLPSAFVRVDRLPLTPNGKVARTGLPDPASAETLQDDAPDAPVSETEMRIAEIVGELLQLDEIDVDDNFFMLGGHSLLGAQLIARLRQSFGVDIALRSLFEAPTVAALSSEVERLREGAAG